MKPNTVETEVKHTPTPWIANKHDIDVETKRGRELIATAYPMNHIEGDGEANAAFIVRAVNSHEALVAIAKEAAKYLRGIEPEYLRMEEIELGRLVEDGLKAIAQAEKV